jgi:vancomycin resistance protein YoaR
MKALCLIPLFCASIAATEAKVTFPITRYEYAVTANLDKAATTLNELTIAAGADFSLNTTLGPRNAATGYKKAPVFGGGGVSIREFGGGLCMVSSLLYNLFLVAGLEITERHAHQRVVKYTAPGLDATIDFNRKDLRVKNILPYAVKIRLVRHGKYLTGELYATGKHALPTDIRVEREVASDMIPGALEPGFRVRTVRVHYAGGFPRRKEILSEDTFLPIDHAAEGGPFE